MKRIGPLSALFALLLVAACGGGAPKTTPAVTPETVEAPQPPKPKITSAQLLGQPGPWVAMKLGDPHFVRTERTANIWQYKATPCVLNLFLYKENEDAPRVLHFDARTADGGNADRDTCLAAVQD